MLTRALPPILRSCRKLALEIDLAIPSLVAIDGPGVLAELTIFGNDRSGRLIASRPRPRLGLFGLLDEPFLGRLMLMHRIKQLHHYRNHQCQRSAAIKGAEGVPPRVANFLSPFS